MHEKLQQALILRPRPRKGLNVIINPEAKNINFISDHSVGTIRIKMAANSGS